MKNSYPDIQLLRCKEKKNVQVRIILFKSRRKYTIVGGNKQLSVGVPPMIAIASVED